MLRYPVESTKNREHLPYLVFIKNQILQDTDFQSFNNPSIEDFFATDKDDYLIMDFFYKGGFFCYIYSIKKNRFILQFFGDSESTLTFEKYSKPMPFYDLKIKMDEWLDDYELSALIHPSPTILRSFLSSVFHNNLKFSSFEPNDLEHRLNNLHTFLQRELNLTYFETNHFLLMSPNIDKKDVVFASDTVICRIPYRNKTIIFHFNVQQNGTYYVLKDFRCEVQ